MKKIVIILTSLLISVAVHAQNHLTKLDKNTGLFGIVEASFIKNYSLIHSISGQNASDTHLDAGQSVAYSLNVMMGYYVIPKRLSLGLGFGLDGYHVPDMNTAPLYGDLRYYLKSARKTPFVYLDYGGLVKLGDAFHKGQMLRIGAGYKFFVSKKLCMTTDLNFNFKSVSNTDVAFGSKDAIFVKGVAITVGFFLF